MVGSTRHIVPAHHDRDVTDPAHPEWLRSNCIEGSPRTVFDPTLNNKTFFTSLGPDRYSKKAFTLIEMVIAIAILALLVAVVVPNLMQRSPKYERQQFVTKLNALTQFAWQHAITTGKLHRMFFNIRKRSISVQEATDSSYAEASADKQKFKTVKNAYLSTDYAWPKQLSVQSAYIDGKDVLQIFDEAYEFWFYLVPSGLTQDVVLNFEDRKDTLAGRPRQLGLVLNPFTAQFKAYDRFQKP